MSQDPPSEKTVLIVEDSPVQAFALVRLLEKEGLNVLCAPNGLTGLAMAREYRPDLIVLDVQMPEMNGLDVCQALKQDERTRAIPVIFFTGQSERHVLEQGLSGCAVDFIPKDAFSDMVLLETLRELRLLPSKNSTGSGSLQ